MFGTVSLTEMLGAREARAARQRALMGWDGVLVCLTMNIPGPQKTSPLILQAFYDGVHRAQRALAQCGSWEKCALILEKTGPEAYYRVRAGANQVKRALCAVEDTAPLGRLMDLDVMRTDGRKCSREEIGLPPRRCLLCDEPAFVCARSRRHSVEAMTGEIENRITRYKTTEYERIGALAADALHREAETTPKPGLVDRRNQGSHPDMTLEMFLRSASVLRGYFTACAATGGDTAGLENVFEPLRGLGISAEKRMLDATGGVNTHKGAIFALGLLCAAAGHCRFQAASCTAEAVCEAAGRISAPAMTAYFAALTRGSARTCGERLYLASGIRGIRGEAAAGFPSLRETALPVMRAALAAGESENDAGVRTLLALLTRVTDTTLLKRGGPEGVAYAREAAGKILKNGFSIAAVETLDDHFISRNLTCGGCADLLACAYFLLAAAP